MKFENVGFPVREPMLASGEVDAVFGFSNSSFINLKSRGVPVEDITLMLMADYGVELYGNVVMVSPRFLAEKPEAVRGFLRALTKGIKDVVANPGEGAGFVIKRNDVAKIEVETERLKMTLDQNVVTPWVKTNGIGGIDKERWARALEQIGLTFSFKDKARAGDALSTRSCRPRRTASSEASSLPRRSAGAFVCGGRLGVFRRCPECDSCLWRGGWAASSRGFDRADS